MVVQGADEPGDWAANVICDKPERRAASMALTTAVRANARAEHKINGHMGHPADWTMDNKTVPWE